MNKTQTSVPNDSFQIIQAKRRKLRSLRNLQDEVTAAYVEQYRSPNNESVKALALAVARYDRFHVVVGGMNPERAVDFADTCAAIEGELRRHASALAEQWSAEYQKMAVAFATDKMEGATTIPQLPYLSALTLDQVGIPAAAYATKTFSCYPRKQR